MIKFSPRTQHRISSTSTANRTFNILRGKDPSKAKKILDAIDIAAKYLVYKLYDATRRDRVERAMQRG